MAISAVILGERLKAARIKKDYSQEKVAELIGMSPYHLGRIENGKKNIYLNKLAVWCDVLDVSIESILAGAIIPDNPAYNRQFGEIAHGCSEETVSTMLNICRQIADVEKRSHTDAQE